MSYDEDTDREWGSVEPYTGYEAYCGYPVPADPDDVDSLDGDCEWEWQAGRYQSDADCQVELRVHLRQEHGIDLPLPSGYSYLQERLNERYSQL